ncbi:hypothetical protein ES703_119062 [subsurface metagenome]
MAYEIVKRVFRQHSSLVIVLPLYLRKLLNIHQGDHVVFQVEDDQGKRVIFSKLDFGVLDHGRDNGDSG